MPRRAASNLLNSRRLLAGGVRAYAACELVTAALGGAAFVFGPWAFGTTENWSIWTLNICGFFLGLLLIAKLAIRSFVARQVSLGRYQNSADPGRPRSSAGVRHLPAILASLTVAILVYCASAAINARATFDPMSGGFDYRPSIPWLPRSFDAHSTWAMFWRLLSLAGLFWALTDWFSAPSGCLASQLPANLSRATPEETLLRRLKPLVWTLAISGGLLAIFGIVQRTSNSSKLLFLVRPAIHQSAQTQFASYAYRGNAAQYFNLVWPVTLAFWWLIRVGRARSHGQHSLLLCAVLMAACPIISAARGGTLAALGMLLVASVGLAWHGRSFRPSCTRHRAGRVFWLACFFVATLSLGIALGWKTLAPRLESPASALRGREDLNEKARSIASDYPVFGTGPGTFESVYQLYRGSSDAYWPAQLHNDWLEARVTFGWMGCALWCSAGVVLALRLVLSSRRSRMGALIFCLCLSLAGCLVQARWDFPLQIYSIQWLFVAWCAVLFAVPRTCNRAAKGSKAKRIERVSMACA